MTTIQKCAGLSPTGTQQCAYREACKRYTMPEAENQQWASFYAIAGDDCEHFIPMAEVEAQPIKFRPSNGTEGDIFFSGWCHQCTRDKAMSEGKDYDECTDDEMCKIIGATMCYYIDDAEYPSEWIYKDGTPTCTAFVKAGEAIPLRCELTVDMFEVTK